MKNHVTGFEPATSRLTSRPLPIEVTHEPKMGQEGFEPSKTKPADLQSAPINHSGTDP